MAKEKIVASTSQPKKPKLFETVKVPSNLRRFFAPDVHLIDFFNTANNPIEVEDMENPSK